jgi:hypothetical protein
MDRKPSHKDTAASSSVELPAGDAQKIYDELRDLHVERWRLGQDFVQSVENLDPLERAEAWLKHVAENENIYVALEAVVYLTSRGYSCSDTIRNIVTTWKKDEERAVDTYAYDQKIRLGKDISGVQAADILKQSPICLTPFWESHPPQDSSFIATMLRTVEWCKIGGFDHWWNSLSRGILEGVYQIGVDPVPSSYYMFDMCRSDYALELMRKALGSMLDALAVPEHDQSCPWRRRNLDNPREVADHFPYAASIVFATQRVCPSTHETELVRGAEKVLLSQQDAAGFWRYSSVESQPSILSTAMTMHALALSRQRGWKHAVDTAAEWLWSVQDKSGCWIDWGCDSVSLTVLVLDALELAAGSTKVTFTVLAHSKEKMEQDAISDAILRRIDEMHDDLKRGQEAIYGRIDNESRLALDSILKEIQQGRIEQGQLQRTVDSIRRALKRIQEVGLPVDDEELTESLNQIYRAVNSDLSFRQKLELSIPIIPLLLEYKIELGAGVDLGAAWEELIK